MSTEVCDVVAVNVSTRVFEGEKTQEESIPPLGLGLLLTIANHNGMKGSLIDMESEQLSPQAVSNRINDTKPRLVALNVLTPSRTIGLSVARGIDPDITLVLGGAHATALPERTIREFCQVHPKTIVLSGSVGRVENSFTDLLDGKSPEFIAGAYWVNQDKIAKSLALPTLMSLSSMPAIDRDIFKTDPYIDHNTGRRESAMITKINCPCDCSFCAGSRFVTQAKTETRTDGQIVEEFSHLAKYRKAQSIRIVDDLLLGSKREIHRLFSTWERIDVKNIFWRANGRANLLASYDRTIMRALADTNLFEVAFGIESGVGRILKLINKGIKLDQVIKAIDGLASVGIKSKGYFIVGFPGETAEETKETFSFATKLKRDFRGMFRAQIFTFRAYPGTRDWYSLIQEGWTEDQLLMMEAKGRGARPQTEVTTDAQFAELHPETLAAMIDEFDAWQES